MPSTTVTQLFDPAGFSSDPFTNNLRDGARNLIEQAIHAELAVLIAAFSAERLEGGLAHRPFAGTQGDDRHWSCAHEDASFAGAGYWRRQNHRHVQHLATIST